jgi:hypothetical protein
MAARLHTLANPTSDSPKLTARVRSGCSQTRSKSSDLITCRTRADVLMLFVFTKESAMTEFESIASFEGNLHCEIAVLY